MEVPAKTEEVFVYLKECATRMRTVTYGEIGSRVGLAAAGVGKPLRYIRDEVCRARSLPWLNAIAVSTDTWRPGDKFLPDGVAIGTDEERLWRGMVLQVFAYDWTPIELGRGK